MTKDEAMKMALEELETQVEHHSGAYLAIEALRQALAEHEQEPVDLLKQSEREGWRYANECELEIKRLRAEKREWVGLTNDEIDNLNLSNKIKIKQLILLIETKLKEKNLCR